MSDKYMALWLEGPLQSWGSESLYSRRDTLNFPTLSGVMGIICSAMGRGGEEREFLAEFANCHWHVSSYELERADKTSIAASRLEDFHMVGSGYDDNNKWQKLSIPKTSEGKPAVGGGAKMTFRYYLENAAFGVIMSIPEERAAEIESALLSPIWSIFLGRKNCVPSEVVFQGVYENQANAHKKVAEIAQLKMRRKAFEVSSEIENADEIIQLKDVPVQFGSKKQYKNRQVALTHSQNQLG
ncbi:MAG: type I-E CRISPR-associated protein Cas5/CasD [Limnobacter sp.]|uniref:type I-E CRISPR-associated protein Cas5/CasD n=1 Tax=Limnobacter sp. TaxID=2003368 RepID=UPI0032EB16C8